MTTEYLYQQEVDRVLSALMLQNQLIGRVMLHTGRRLSDALRMPSKGLSTSGWYTETKTGKKRLYGLPKPLLEVIREQAGPEWAFPGREKALTRRGRRCGPTTKTQAVTSATHLLRGVKKTKRLQRGVVRDARLRA